MPAGDPEISRLRPVRATGATKGRRGHRRIRHYSEEDDYQRFESYDANDTLRTEMTITEDSMKIVEYDENGSEIRRSEDGGS